MRNWFKGSLILAVTSLLLVAQVAYAAVYSRTNTAYIKMAAPAGLANGEGRVWVRDLGKCNAGAQCVGNGQTGTWNAIAKNSAGTVITWTGWAKCKAKDNRYKLIVRQEKTAGVTWTWPHTLTCEHLSPGGNTYRRVTTLANSVRPASSVKGIGNVTFAAGLKVELWSSANRKETASSVLGVLPAGSYTDAHIDAIKAGVVWPGVGCVVDELGSGQVDIVKVIGWETAAEGVGKCVINGADFKVEVDDRT